MMFHASFSDSTRRLLAKLTVVMALSACGFPSEEATLSDFEVDQLTVDPTETDAEIVATVSGSHIVFYPKHLASPRDELMVFMPGTAATVDGYSGFIRGAAFVGYRSIGLAYMNSASMSERCEGSPPECLEQVREEQQTGTDTSDVFDVNPANAIENRLIKLLEHLDAQHPDQGWGEYLLDGQPVWSRLIVAGHSQGSGQSAWIAKEYVVSRAIYFSNPGDGYQYGTTEESYGNAPWALVERATPPDRQFLLFHAEEHSSIRVQEVIDTQGMGEIVSADNVASPYGGAQVLKIENPASSPSNAHNQTVHNSAVPIGDNGLPKYWDAYLYLLNY